MNHRIDYKAKKRSKYDCSSDESDKSKNSIDSEEPIIIPDRNTFIGSRKSRKRSKKIYLTQSSLGNSTSNSSERIISRPKYYDSSSSEEIKTRPKRTPKKKISPQKTKKKDFPPFVSSDDPDSKDKETIGKADKLIKSAYVNCKICLEDIEPDDDLLCYKCDEIFHK